MLTILSALLTLSCYLSVVGIVPLILAIVALTRNAADPVGSRRLTRIGWIVLAVLLAVLVAVVVVGVVLVTRQPNISGSFD